MEKTIGSANKHLITMDISVLWGNNYFDESIGEILAVLNHEVCACDRPESIWGTLSDFNIVPLLKVMQ